MARTLERLKRVLELGRAVDDVDTDHEVRRDEVVLVEELVERHGSLNCARARQSRVSRRSDAGSLTGRGPSSKLEPNTPSGASQRSSWLRH